MFDEDQTLSFDATLILCPLGAPTRHVGTYSATIWVERTVTLIAARQGRSRSPAATLFFEAELLGMHEVPHRVVVDLQATSGKLGNEPPPIWPGATLPVSSTRRIQPMAVLIVTPNRLAA